MNLNLKINSIIARIVLLFSTFKKHLRIFFVFIHKKALQIKNTFLWVFIQKHEKWIVKQYFFFLLVKTIREIHKNDLKYTSLRISHFMHTLDFILGDRDALKKFNLMSVVNKEFEKKFFEVVFSENFEIQDILSQFTWNILIEMKFRNELGILNRSKSFSLDVENAFAKALYNKT